MTFNERVAQLEAAGIKDALVMVVAEILDGLFALQPQELAFPNEFDFY